MCDYYFVCCRVLYSPPFAQNILCMHVFLSHKHHSLFQLELRDQHRSSGTKRQPSAAPRPTISMETRRPLRPARRKSEPSLLGSTLNASTVRTWWPLLTLQEENEEDKEQPTEVEASKDVIEMMEPKQDCVSESGEDLDFQNKMAASRDLRTPTTDANKKFDRHEHKQNDDVRPNTGIFEFTNLPRLFFTTSVRFILL